jgi:1,4-alpha-glucan branching enzyme
VRQWALDKAAAHAGNFMFNRQRQVEWLNGWMGRKPIVVAPYDAELFGHWWFEGPEWLDYLFRKIACDQDVLRPVTPSEYLDEFPVNQMEMPAASSWGYKGYNEVWLNGANDWIYRHLHAAAERMIALARKFPSATGVSRRALNQAARELLLAQASDWSFIISRGTVVPYAVQRTKEHLLRFSQLYDTLGNGTVNEGWLGAIEARDNIFPNLDYRVYRPDYRFSAPRLSRKS